MSVVSPWLRSRVRAGAEPIAQGFGRVGLTPNMLTVIGFLIAAVGAVLAAKQAWLVSGLVVAFGAIFDLFDGALARATGRTSRLGAFLDSTFDRAGEAVVYIGIAIGFGAYLEPGLSALPGVFAAMAAMAASFLVSYVRAKSESLGFTPGTGMANVGLAPREVRLTILAAALVVAGLIRPSMIGPIEPSIYYWWYALVGALGLITILATLTTIQRIVHVYRQAKKEP